MPDPASPQKPISLLLSGSVEDLRGQFFALRTREDVAHLLEVDVARLNYHLHIVPLTNRYTTFQIAKKSGGVRQITAPVTALKILQQKLNHVLQCVYQPKASVHGFTLGRSIVSNAEIHKRRRFVLNIDLKDFFPSINFGRVRGMFMAVPYKLTEKAATVLAQICCFDNQLPQGAPTSPIVSNMLCAKMDSRLLRLAEKHRCIYTRYADDLSFSTSMPHFPEALARISGQTGQVEVGEELHQIVVESGFDINTAKVRLQKSNRRQEVTGLTTNRFPNVQRRYVRQIRAMLYAWKEFGLEAAQVEYLSRYDKKHRNPTKPPPRFELVVRGKLEFLRMVKGSSDPVYRNYRARLEALAPELVKESDSETLAEGHSGNLPLILTEGQTDWKHLEAALRNLKGRGLLSSLNAEVFRYVDDAQGGDEELLRMCREYSKTPQHRATIFVFDRDKSGIVKKVSGEGGGFKDWGNWVYSFALPVPDHRQGAPDISIEFYYQDSEITRKDSQGRRLFLSNKFLQSFRHKEENLNCGEISKMRRDAVSIIDNQVFNAGHENVALPKSAFADNVLGQVAGFDDFDFSQFMKVFNVVQVIVRDYQRAHGLLGKVKARTAVEL